MSTSPNEDGRPTQGGAAAPVHVMNPISVTLTGTIPGTVEVANDSGNPIPVSVADGADVAEGATTDAAVSTDAAGTVSAKLRGFIVLMVNFLTRLPAALGQGTMAQSLRVVLPSDQSAVPVDTELPAAAALADAAANPTTPTVGADNMVFNGTTWDRQRTAIPNTTNQTTGVQAVGLYALGNSQATLMTLECQRSVTDASSPVYAGLFTIARPQLWNGASWDNQRNNHEVTALASAARTASVDSADLVNYNSRGALIVVDITALTATGTLTVNIQGKDTLSGKYYNLLSSALLAATGTTVLVVYPGTTISANLDANSPLPRIWRVDVVAGNGVSITYSVGVNYIL